MWVIDIKIVEFFTRHALVWGLHACILRLFFRSNVKKTY